MGVLDRSWTVLTLFKMDLEFSKSRAFIKIGVFGRSIGVCFLFFLSGFSTKIFPLSGWSTKDFFVDGRTKCSKRKLPAKMTTVTEDHYCSSAELSGRRRSQ